ncbi:DUF6193 family natural product biosynthesis protein [Streptomyces sp. C]|uniref:DUF6193 family natural product biosynthesis protein n=1 Tax=Streptomyces sp. C TaxID=253839 RepID=UPI0001DEFBA4|nr:DUF6193 family natural product biosynthesis protein [Streptomyces sp. C]EFL19940.1 predicted protein [Streptomyces sp. C]
MSDGTRPDPVLYPELASENGSLVAALRVISHRLGILLPGLVEAHPRQGLSVRFAAAVKTEFGDIRIDMRPESRDVMLTISMPLIGVAGSGSTTSLKIAVEIAQAWQSGMPLAEMSSNWGFLNFSPKALAHDQGAGVEFEWGVIRKLSPELIDQKMVEAAYVTPELRALFPMPAHGSLQFRRRTISAPGSDIPSIFPAAGGCWTVISLHDPQIPRPTVSSAEEAVRLVVAGLPAGCGPAVEVIHAARRKARESHANDQSERHTKPDRM